VQLDDRLAPRGVVQAIDVLGDQAGEHARDLELDQRAMRGLGRAPASRGQPSIERAQ